MTKRLINCDLSGNLLINHSGGFSVYNESTKIWQHFPEQHTELRPKHSATRSVTINEKGIASFLTKWGVGTFKDNKIKYLYNSDTSFSLNSNYTLGWYNDELWLFPIFHNKRVYKIDNGKFITVDHPQLNEVLSNAQVTSIKRLSDGYLWICTYNGIIRYQPETDEAITFYPEMIFSDCMIDREGNYWFTTLQYGLIRVPDLNSIVWNNFENTKLSKVITDNKYIFFTSVNGDVGSLNPQNKTINIIGTGSKSDIQAFNYIPDDDQVFLYTFNSLMTYDGAKIKSKLLFENAIKHIGKYQNEYFLSGSRGLFVTQNQKMDQIQTLRDGWFRETIYDHKHKTVWAVGNQGIIRFEKDNNAWIITDSFFADRQFLSLTIDSATQNIYTLQFDGTFYAIQPDKSIDSIGKIPGKIQTYRIKYYKNKLYFSTNQGVYVFDINRKTLKILNTFNGLASNNIRELIILNEELWLATGKGLQKIPLNQPFTPPLAIVHVKNMDTGNIILKSSESLVIIPEASTYSSNGNFEYAYQLNNNEWVKLPSSIDQIEIQNMRPGAFTLDLKVIDHLDRDSENIINLKGMVQAHFWETWWFYALMIISFIAIVFYITRRTISNIKSKELQKNELLNMQLKAIRAQMNPHFMYNTLNSIQDLILQQDIKNTNYYLSRFSQLMRQILNFSEEEDILIAEEKDMLENYLTQKFTGIVMRNC